MVGFVVGVEQHAFPSYGEGVGFVGFETVL
jgi:hypothetical protein